MGRFPSAGRGGRAGSDSYRLPKYLDVLPKPPRFHTPPLTPESSTHEHFDEEISFTTSRSPLDEVTNLFSSNAIDDENNNGWITSKKRTSSSPTKYLDQLTSTSSPSTL